MKTVLGLLGLCIAAMVLAAAQQPASSADFKIPKDWRAVREKHGCVLAIPREWPSPGTNWFGTKDREVEVILQVRPLVTPLEKYKQSIASHGYKIVQETDTRVLSVEGMSVNRVLVHHVRQILSGNKDVCYVDIIIQHPSDLPRYGDIAKGIAESVHAE